MADDDRLVFEMRPSQETNRCEKAIKVAVHDDLIQIGTTVMALIFVGILAG